MRYDHFEIGIFCLTCFTGEEAGNLQHKTWMRMQEYQQGRNLAAKITLIYSYVLSFDKVTQCYQYYKS